jgi:dihydrofolate reductase
MRGARVVSASALPAEIREMTVPEAMISARRSRQMCVADKVVWHTTMSIDGYIADRNDSLGWAFGQDGWLVPHFDEIIASVGAVLIGRRMYDLGATSLAEAKLYGGAYTGPVFVLTHRPPEEPRDPAVVFVSAGAVDAVAHARAAADGKDVMVLGCGIASQCLTAGLIDELLIHQVPVLLGDGVRLFANPGGPPVTLEMADVTPAGQIANFRLRVKQGCHSA